MGLLECPHDMMADVLMESDPREHNVEGYPSLLNTKLNLCGSYLLDFSSQILIWGHKS